MPKVICPDCKKAFGDTLSTCPKCGREFTPDELASLKAQLAKEGNRVVLGLGIVVLLVVVGWLYFGGGDESPPAQPVATKEASEPAKSDLTPAGEVIGVQLRLASALSLPSSAMKSLSEALEGGGNPVTARRLALAAADDYQTAIYTIENVKTPSGLPENISDLCEKCKAQTLAACQDRIAALNAMVKVLDGQDVEASQRRYGEKMDTGNLQLKMAKSTIDTAVILARDLK
ncbi:MAG: FYDLN acid domain-containing protein [Deltaproteobacteria bacterium]|nr:FYDLN acid domain-containing protein [Deltaproteobacteria bacterium]